MVNVKWSNWESLEDAYEPIAEDTIGVYVIRLTLLDDDFSFILYVGRSKNLRGRLKEHYNHPLTLIPMFLVRWAKVREDHVKGVERFLIDFYNPPKNIHSVEAQPIEVNLPFPAIKWIPPGETNASSDHDLVTEHTDEAPSTTSPAPSA